MQLYRLDVTSSAQRYMYGHSHFSAWCLVLYLQDPRYPQMPAGHLLSCPWSSSEHSPPGNYPRLLNTSLCDCLRRQSPTLKPELAILLHAYYFLFGFIKIHPARGDNLIKPFSLHSIGNFISLLTTLPISLSSAHIISTDVMSVSRMIFHQMEPLSGEPTKKARLFFIRS